MTNYWTAVGAALSLALCAAAPARAEDLVGDAYGVSYWTTQLDAGAMSRVAVATAATGKAIIPWASLSARPVRRSPGSSPIHMLLARTAVQTTKVGGIFAPWFTQLWPMDRQCSSAEPKMWNARVRR